MWHEWRKIRGKNVYVIDGNARKKERKRPLGRPKRRWMDNIKIDLAETECDGVYWCQAPIWDPRPISLSP
jgi:hypothetical protein